MATALGAALLPAAVASADTYVYASDGYAWQMEGAGTGTFWRRPESNVLGAAFDSNGRLWLAQNPVGDLNCLLTSPDAPDISIVPQDLAYPGGTRSRNIHLCEPARGPGNSLFVEGHNGTQGSAVVWQLDLGNFAIKRIVYGSQPALGPAGQLAVIQHTYERSGKVTVWDSLAVGPLQSPRKIRRAVPRPRTYSSPGTYWAGPSYGPGGRFAVARDGRPLVGRPGAWSAVGRRGMNVSGTAWDSVGDLYVVGNSSSGGTIQRIAGGRPGSPETWTEESESITALAIGPDASSATAPVPSVVGMSVSDAQAGLAAAGFTLSGTRDPTDPDRTPSTGTVSSQSPPAGALASRRNLVTLTVAP